MLGARLSPFLIGILAMVVGALSGTSLFFMPVLLFDRIYGPGFALEFYAVGLVFGSVIAAPAGLVLLPVFHFLAGPQPTKVWAGYGGALGGFTLALLVVVYGGPDILHLRMLLVVAVGMVSGGVAGACYGAGLNAVRRGR